MQKKEKTNSCLFDFESDEDLRKIVEDDPVTELLLSGKAQTVAEAETKFLNENTDRISDLVLKLVASDLSENEFASHPLIMLLRSHGSRRWEDSLV